MRSFQESALAIVFPGTSNIQPAKFFDDSRKFNFQREKRLKIGFFVGDKRCFKLKSSSKSSFSLFLKILRKLFDKDANKDRLRLKT
ncbi:hypothetical protein DRW41_06765 [Neobacillus piezotolerans]|uniref:Uncharacterized protein n=1 Tax=Neobacillus piezotolerans TaxID=2259171 RepID=A0A3D8GSX0_9BACI|nr:hypothetical protein DRW41_06765 [Neobacillus piezotolerans]